MVTSKRRSLRILFVSTLFVGLSGVAVSWSDEPRGEIAEIDPPAAPGASSPTIASEGATTVTRDHEILMTWLEPGESGERLRFARRSEEGWSQPITIAEPVSAIRPADRPSLTVIETQAVRRTLIARTGDVLARSGDAGRTWGRLPAPPLPFSSFAGGDDGAYAFWLETDGDGPTQLLGTRVMAGRDVLDDQVLDGSGTSAAMSWDGPVAVYRDRSEEGGEKIALVRRQDASWTEPSSVHVERWRPSESVDGPPQVAAMRRRIAVAWYTEAPPRPRVLVAYSTDAGRSFGLPVEVDGRDREHVPLGAVDVAVGDDGDAFVVWTSADGPEETTLNLARVSADGGGEPIVIVRGREGHIGGFPQITLADDRAAITWLDREAGRIRAVTIPVVAIPAKGGRIAEAADTPAVVPHRQMGRGRPGDPAPNHTVQSLAGDEVSLDSLRGRAVLVNLWATWCLPCRAEMPELAALHERYKVDGLVVVGVSVDDRSGADRVRAFVSERAIPFEIWMDPEGRMADSLRVRALPATFLVDKEGRIVLRRDEAITGEDPLLERAIERALTATD